MSEGRNERPRPTANASWLFSEPANRAIRYSLLSPTRIVEEAVRDIRDNVRRNLNEDYSSGSLAEPELGANVITEREFSFGEIDTDLITSNELQNPVAESITSTPSRLTHRSEFSLTSYDSSIFDSEEIYRAQNMSQLRITSPRHVPAEDVDREIERLRDEAERTPNEANPRIQDEARRVTIEPPNEVRDMLYDLMREMREMRMEIDNLRDQDREQRLNPHINEQDRREYGDERFSIAYGRTSNDIRNQAGHAIGYLRLKEARDMIPEFDGTSNKLQEFLSALSYAIKNINPLEEGTLLEAVLCTKLKGRAMTDFQTREIRNFTQLRKVLETTYLSRRSTTHLQLEFNTLKQKQGESARVFGL